MRFQIFPDVSVKAVHWPKLSLWVLTPHPAESLTNWRTENPHPKQAHWKALPPEAGGFVSMLVLDMDAYGEKAVRKNLTIPAWLNTFAENNHINFSQVLQDSLITLYKQKQHT